MVNHIFFIIFFTPLVRAAVISLNNQGTLGAISTTLRANLFTFEPTTVVGDSRVATGGVAVEDKGREGCEMGVGGVERACVSSV